MPESEGLRSPAPDRPAAGKPQGYIPGFDGLRALAVLAVIGSHLNVPWLKYGSAGVLLFFVLSGFLITGLLLDKVGRPHSARDFFLRRALRTFPIYYILTAFVLILAIMMRWPYSDWPKFAVFMQNFYLAPHMLVEFPGFMNHTWSLAVEEQFYIVWPVAVMSLRMRWLPLLCLLIILACGVGRLVSDARLAAPSWVFAYDCLAWGALGMVVSRTVTISTPTLLLGLGALFIAFCAAAGRSTALFCIVSGPLFLGVLLLVKKDLPWLRILEAPPIKFLGRMSYGMYLYHQPTLYFARAMGHRLHVSEGLSQSLGFVAVLAISAASFTYLEKPLLAWRDRRLGASSRDKPGFDPAR